MIKNFETCNLIGRIDNDNHKISILKLSAKTFQLFAAKYRKTYKTYMSKYTLVSLICKMYFTTQKQQENN